MALSLSFSHHLPIFSYLQEKSGLTFLFPSLMSCLYIYKDQHEGRFYLFLCFSNPNTSCKSSNLAMSPFLFFCWLICLLCTLYFIWVEIVLFTEFLGMLPFPSSRKGKIKGKFVGFPRDHSKKSYSKKMMVPSTPSPSIFFCIRLLELTWLSTPKNSISSKQIRHIIDICLLP